MFSAAVAMDDAKFMRAHHRAGHLMSDVQRPRERQRTLGQRLPQTLAFDVLQGEKKSPILRLAAVGGRGDVRMIDVGGSHRFVCRRRW